MPHSWHQTTGGFIGVILCETVVCERYFLVQTTNNEGSVVEMLNAEDVATPPTRNKHNERAETAQKQSQCLVNLIFYNSIRKECGVHKKSCNQ